MGVEMDKLFCPKEISGMKAMPTKQPVTIIFFILYLLPGNNVQLQYPIGYLKVSKAKV